MKNRKISTAIAEKVMTGVLTILMAISVTACGSTKEQANPAAAEVTEAVYSEYFLVENGTEFDVLEVFENDTEAATFYGVDWNGHREFLWDKDVTVID